MGRRASAELSREDAAGFVEDLRAFGLSEAEIARAQGQVAAAAPEEHFTVHPDNAVALRLFIALQTQWRTASLSTMGKAQVIRTGLDYGVVASTAQFEELQVGRDDFGRLRTLEYEALDAWAHSRARER